VCARAGKPPPLSPADLEPVEIPIEREPGGRFHLASFGVYDVERREKSHTNRRFPIEEAQMFGSAKVRRLQIKGGPCKSYRLEREHLHLYDDRIKWWCLGDKRKVEELLSVVQYLGKRRAVGLGKVVEWSVHKCTPWSRDWPIVVDGRPLRHLPPDWPGLVEPPLAYACLTYPYWRKWEEELCAVPRET
jgi:CRISPR type IV-associated protein Csf3